MTPAENRTPGQTLFLALSGEGGLTFGSGFEATFRPVHNFLARPFPQRNQCKFRVFRIDIAINSVSKTIANISATRRRILITPAFQNSFNCCGAIQQLVAARPHTGLRRRKRMAKRRWIPVSETRSFFGVPRKGLRIRDKLLPPASRRR
jgi:hypothetical protein